MQPFSVIIRPAVSEKSNEVREAEGKYTFIVQMDASKKDVSNAIEKIWGVKVASVRTNIRRGKIKRRGASFTQPKKTKRAVVCLNKGDKLPLFEEQ